MKSIHLAVVLLFALFSTSDVWSQQLCMMMVDEESGKAAALIFESARTYSNAEVSYSNSTLKCHFWAVEEEKELGPPKGQMDIWGIDAELFPFPRVLQSDNVPPNSVGLTGPNITMIGVEIEDESILKKCADHFIRTSGFLEQRLLETSEFVLDRIPDFQSGSLRVVVIDNAPSSEAMIDAEINERAPETTILEELERILSPSISTSISKLAMDTKVDLLEKKRTILLKVPESLMSHALQLKVLGEDGLTIKHQALNRLDTRIVLRQDQWKAKREIQIIQSSGQVIWTSAFSPIQIR